MIIVVMLQIATQVKALRVVKEPARKVDVPVRCRFAAPAHARLVSKQQLVGGEGVIDI